MSGMKRFALLASLFAVTACGDDSTGPGTPVDMTGTWSSNGTLSSGQGFIFMMTLVSSDEIVTGTAQAVGLASGTITGTVAGNKLTFQFAITQPCAATFSGTATVSGRSISGNLNGAATCFGNIQATFSGAKLEQ
jgi:hypothetical protein